MFDMVNKIRIIAKRNECKLFFTNQNYQQFVFSLNRWTYCSHCINCFFGWWRYFCLYLGVSLSSYVSSKHAIFGYFNVMRQELKKFNKNITLSIACPYAINTTLFQGFKSKVDKFLPVLDENYVGIRLVREFVAKK